MDRVSYFKAAIKSKCYRRKDWVVSAFCLTNMSRDEFNQNLYQYKLYRDQTGHYYFDGEKNDLVRITDRSQQEPLFIFLDDITIDHDTVASVKDVVTTKYGNVIINCIRLLDAFGEKFPFVTGKMSIDKIESEIAARLTPNPPEGTPKDPSRLYIDEFIIYADRAAYMNSLDQLATISATEKTMTEPPGIVEFKKQLIKKYEGKLSDPVELNKYENELKDYANKWLAGDKANGTSLSGKVKDIGYKKMFLTIGADQDFKERLDVTTVTNSLEDGWSTDPTEYAALMNGARAGSYSRGSETVKGGVAGKLILRALINFLVENDDCGTKEGLERVYRDGNIHLLVGKYIRVNSQWEFIKDLAQAKTHLDKKIIVRSSTKCLNKGDRICKKCIGDKLSRNPTGLPAAGMEVSSILLNTAMKAMHGKVLSVSHYDYRKVFGNFNH